MVLSKQIIQSDLDWDRSIVRSLRIFLLQLTEDISHIDHLNEVLNLLIAVNHNHSAILPLFMPLKILL